MATSGSYAYSTFGAFCLASICLAASTQLSAQSKSPAIPAETLPVVTICGDAQAANNIELMKKAETISGIIDELKAERGRFLAKGDPADLFAALYFHTTRAEFAYVLSNDPEVRPEMLDMIITFYDAYRSNRDAFAKGGSGAVEPHWRSYYKGAVTARKGGANSMGTIIGLLLSAVDAHLSDLSRTIRHEFERSPRKKDAIVASYDKMDPIFADAAKRSNDDIIEGLNAAPTLRSLDSTFKFGETYVIHARHRAMELALSGERLKVKRPQPHIDHTNRSQVNFAVTKVNEPCR